MASMGEKRTPMAWQHRDINYHHGQYATGVEMGQMRPGPPSTSDRLSHRTDKSWRTQKDSQVAAYQPARPPHSTGRPPSRPQSASASSSSTSSSSESDSEQDDMRGQMQGPPQPLYGAYPGEGYYPGYPPPGSMVGYPPSVSQYPGTIKSAKSVPALGTWDGEPCPVHHVGPMSMPGPMMMAPPSVVGVPPPRRAASIYDMRLISPPPPPSQAQIYGTLPMRPPGGDRRSLVGAPNGIPSQLLPPMVRPRPIVLNEGGTAEPLPVRAPTDKVNGISGLTIGNKGLNTDRLDKKKQGCRGGVYVGLTVMGVVCTGLLLGVLLVFIL